MRESVFYGPDVDAAFAALNNFQFVREALARTDEPPAKISQQLRDLLERHMTANGVLFDSRAWIITARRAME